MLGAGGFFEDGLVGCGPIEGNGVLIVLGEIVVDGGFQLGDAFEGAATDGFFWVILAKKPPIMLSQEASFGTRWTHAGGAGGMKTIMGSHLTNAAKLSNDWGPPLFTLAGVSAAEPPANLGVQRQAPAAADENGDAQGMDQGWRREISLRNRQARRHRQSPGDPVAAAGVSIPSTGPPNPGRR